MSRRRLRSTAMCVILWLSASSGLLDVEACRGRFLFLRSFGPAAAADLVGPVVATATGCLWWTVPLVSDSDVWVMQLSSCSTARALSLSGVRSCSRQFCLCNRSRSSMLDSCAQEVNKLWCWYCCSWSSTFSSSVSSSACMAPWSSWRKGVWRENRLSYLISGCSENLALAAPGSMHTEFNSSLTNCFRKWYKKG